VGRGSLSKLLNLLFNLSSLTNSVAEVVELGTSNLTETNDLYLSYMGRVEGEGLLNAAAISYSAHCEGLRDTAAVTCDNCALKDLDSFSCALTDEVVDLDCVAHVELRNIFSQLLACKSFKFCHFDFSFFFWFRGVRTEPHWTARADFAAYEWNYNTILLGMQYFFYYF